MNLNQESTNLIPEHKEMKPIKRLQKYRVDYMYLDNADRLINKTLRRSYENLHN